MDLGDLMFDPLFLGFEASQSGMKDVVTY